MPVGSSATGLDLRFLATNGEVDDEIEKPELKLV